MAMLTNAISEKLVAGILLVLNLLVYSFFDDGAFQFGDDTFVIAVVGQSRLRLVEVDGFAIQQFVQLFFAPVLQRFVIIEDAIF